MADYPYNQLTSPLGRRFPLDETYVFSNWYCPDPPVLTPCPNCCNLLDWFTDHYECNWCCRTWPYEHMKHWAMTGVHLIYTQQGSKEIRIKVYTCFDALPASQCYLIDDLLDRLVEIFWIERFIRQAKKKVVSKRDLAFCRFLYLSLSNYFLLPHSFLWNRFESIYDSLSILTPLLMYTNTNELISNLSKVGIELAPRRELNHEWWQPKRIRYRTPEEAYEALERVRLEPEADLFGPRLAIKEGSNGDH